MSKLPVWAMGYALRQAGVPCAEEIAMMLARKSKSKSVYLYGEASLNGDIGLFTGNSVTPYKGAVLPKRPDYDKAKYPYAYIQRTVVRTAFWFRACEAPAVWSEGINGFRLVKGGNEKAYFLDLKDAFPFWEERTCDLVIHNEGIEGNVLVWANHAVHKPDGSLLVSGTAPIPVDEVPWGSYNGILLPALPKPVDGAECAFVTNDSDRYILYQVNANNLMVGTANGRFGLIAEFPMSFGSAVEGDKEWSDYQYIGAGGSGVHRDFESIVWSNFTATSNETGEVWLESSPDPIPVYEQRSD